MHVSQSRPGAITGHAGPIALRPRLILDFKITRANQIVERWLHVIKAIKQLRARDSVSTISITIPAGRHHGLSGEAASSPSLTSSCRCSAIEHLVDVSHQERSPAPDSDRDPFSRRRSRRSGRITNRHRASGLWLSLVRLRDKGTRRGRGFRGRNAPARAGAGVQLRGTRKPSPYGAKPASEDEGDQHRPARGPRTPNGRAAGVPADLRSRTIRQENAHRCQAHARSIDVRQIETTVPLTIANRLLERGRVRDNATLVSAVHGLLGFPLPYWPPAFHRLFRTHPLPLHHPIHV